MSRVLIVLTGKKHRTGVAAPNQYRKTVQQQVIDSNSHLENALGDITQFLWGPMSTSYNIMFPSVRGSSRM